MENINYNPEEKPALFKSWLYPTLTVVGCIGLYFFLLGPVFGLWGTSSIFYKPKHMFKIVVLYSNGKQDTLTIFTKSQDNIRLSQGGGLVVENKTIRASVQQITVIP